MKKLPTQILLLFILLFTGILLTTSLKISFASYSQAYQDYLFEFNNYRNAYQEYQVAKSKYLAFQTLVSQNEAIDKTRTVLVRRDNAVSSFLSALKERLAETNGVNENEQAVQNSKIQLLQSFLDNHRAKVEAAATLNDLTSLSKEFETKNKESVNLSNQTVGLIVISRFNFFFDRFDTQKALLSSFVKDIGSTGENTQSYERQIGLIDAKRRLADEKYQTLKNIYFPPEEKNINVEETIPLIQDTYLYLKESTSYLLETIKNIKEE